MAFWKKSEDPWDVDPARAREKREPVENPLDSLRDWNEERRARAAARQAEWEAQPKEVCPWCGKEMERGCLQGSRGVYWYPGPRAASAAWWGPGVFEESLRVDDEGDFLKGTYKTAWYCRECEKMVFSTAHEAPEPPPLQTGEECAAELERYAEDAREDDPEK
nr:PF20097 family protein [uncultured Oscillibacter sp.]